MKTNKLILLILLIACLVNCLLLDYLILVNNSSFEIDILNIIELIIISLNFFFVIWVYYKDEQKDKKQNDLEMKKYWYHDILIEKNIPLLQELIALSIEIIDEIKPDRDPLQIKIELRKVKDKIKALENSIGYMLNAYDEQLYTRFGDYLCEFEDIVVERYVELSEEKINKDTYVMAIKGVEVKIIKLLMGHDFGKP